MGLRRRSRELALQFLFQQELNPGVLEENLDFFCSHFGFSKRTIPYARHLVLEITANEQFINETIQKNATNWRLSRMSVVDRNIMRIAAYELLFEKDIPHSVIIDEAIEIARSFSTDDAGGFINGVLDAIRNTL